MDDIEKEQLKRLSPQERIKRLKEIEKKRKKDLEETDKLIRESIEQIHEKRIEDSEPPAAPFKRAGLFEESELEQQLQDETISAPKTEDGTQNIEYAINLYGELNNIAQEASADNGYVNMGRAAEIYRKIKDTERYQSQDQTVKRIAEGTRRIMQELYDDEHRADLDYK